MTVTLSQSQNNSYMQTLAPEPKKPSTLAGKAVEVVRNHPIACAIGCAAAAGVAFWGLSGASLPTSSLPIQTSNSIPTQHSPPVSQCARDVRHLMEQYNLKSLFLAVDNVVNSLKKEILDCDSVVVELANYLFKNGALAAKRAVILANTCAALPVSKQGPGCVEVIKHALSNATKAGVEGYLSESFTML